MKIEHTRDIGLFDIAPDKTLKLESMARFFQDMAIGHSSQVGAGPDELFSRGVVWFLHRLEIEVLRYPVFGETVNISTWSRGFRHHMGLREYRIESDQGLAVRASSVWVFFDFRKKRVVRVPSDIEALYQFEPQKNFETELSTWNPSTGIEPEQEIDISLRYGDFDINHHVNNTIYPGFIETLFHNTLSRGGEKIQHMKLRFGREIPQGKTSVRCGWQTIRPAVEPTGKSAGKPVDAKAYRFVVIDPRDSSCLYADGEFLL